MPGGLTRWRCAGLQKSDKPFLLPAYPKLSGGSNIRGVGMCGFSAFEEFGSIGISVGGWGSVAIAAVADSLDKVLPTLGERLGAQGDRRQCQPADPNAHPQNGPHHSDGICQRGGAQRTRRRVGGAVLHPSRDGCKLTANPLSQPHHPEPLLQYLPNGTVRRKFILSIPPIHNLTG